LRSELWAVVNLTDDSFYADSRKNLGEAIQAAHAAWAAGASVVDIGAESTRPGAIGVSAEIQINRLSPFIESFEKSLRVKISVDTRSIEVAEKVIPLGIGYINDVSGGSVEMARLIAKTGCGYVLTHSLSEPQTMQNNPTYTDVVAEVQGFLLKQTSLFLSAGARPDQIIWDAGIGFGKTLEHNLKLIATYPQLAKHGHRMLAGVSRKSFIAKLLNEAPPENRLFGSLGAQLYLALHGCDILRVHDVREMHEALAVAGAIKEYEL